MVYRGPSRMKDRAALVITSALKPDFDLGKAVSVPFSDIVKSK